MPGEMMWLQNAAPTLVYLVAVIFIAREYRKLQEKSDARYEAIITRYETLLEESVKTLTILSEKVQ